MATIDFVVKNGLVVTEEAQVLSTTDATSSNDTAAAVYTAGGAAIAKKAFVGTDLSVGGNTTFTGDLSVNGGDLTTTAGTFNLINGTATTVNFAGAATAIEIGAATGTTNINNSLDVDGDVNIDGGDLTTSATTFNLINATASTVNLAGAATTINMGAAGSAGTTTIKTDNVVLDGDLQIKGGDLTTTAGTFNLINETATTVNFAGAATAIEIGAATGTTNINNNLDVDGDVNIDGGDLTVSTATFNLANTTATTLNIGGAATAVNIGAAGSAGTTTIKTDNVVLDGDLQIKGGDLTTNQTAFNLLNTTATTVNFAGAATDIQIGASTGTTNINNNLDVDGDVNIDGGDLTTSSTTFNLANTTATTLNVGGAATAVSIGAATGTTTINNTNTVVTGDLAVNGGDITTTTTGTATVFNTNATTVNFAGAATAVSIGAATGTTTINNSNTVVTGDLAVNGGDITTTTTGTATVFNTNATTLNVGGAATAVSIGAATGTTTIRNANTVVTGDLAVNGGDLTTSATTFNLIDATAATVNFARAGTAITIGATTGTTTIRNANTVVTGDLAVNGGDITTTSTGTATVFNTNATTLNVGGAATAVSIGAATGTTTINNSNTVVTGDLAVNGGDLTTSATTFNLLNGTATTVNFAGAATTFNAGNSTAAQTINIGTATTDNSTYNFATGPAASAKTKIINVGTGGTTGSRTNVSIGSTQATAISNIATVSRSINIATLTTSALHGLVPGQVVTVICSDTTFNAVDVTLSAGTTGTTIVYPNTGINVTSTSATGTVTFFASTTTINSGRIVGSQTTQDLFNTVATTVNFAREAGTINMGANSGTLTIGNPTVVGTQTTQNLWNTVATTVNFAGAATTVEIGAATGTTSINNSLTVDGNVTLGNSSSDTLTINASSISIPNAITFTEDDASNTTVSFPITITHTTSGTPANGIGTGIQLVTETSAGNNEIGTTIESVVTDVTALSEDFDFVVRQMIAGSAPAQTLKLNGSTLQIGANNTNTTITTQGTANLTLSTNNGTNSGTILINNGTSGNIEITPNGTGDVYLNSDTIRVGDSGVEAIITSNSTGNLKLQTGSTNTGSITIGQGDNANITIAPHGTGDVYIDADTVRIGDNNIDAVIQSNGTGNLIINPGTDLVIGNAGASASPVTEIIRATNGSGTNINAANLQFQGGLSTGTGTGGSITFATGTTLTTGTTLQTATTRMSVSPSANNTTLDLVTAMTTANVFNTTATTVNFAGAATAIEIGAATGTTNINNNLDVDGDVNIDGGNLTASGSTFNLVNTNITTVNFAGAATDIQIGAATGTTNINNNLDVDGDVNIDGGDLTASGSTFNLVNTNITTGNLFGVATAVNIGTSAATASTLTFGPAIGSNTFKIRSVEAGTINLTSDVTTGTVNLFTGTTTGTTNIATGGASTTNIGGAASTLNIGTTTGNSILELRGNSTSGTATIRTNTGVTTVDVFNTVATTGNLFGAATSVRIGDNSGTLTIGNPTIVGTQTSVNLWNTVSTTVNFAGAATGVNIGTGAASASTLTFGPEITGNIVEINSTASGTVTVRSDVTTGTVNLFTGTTTGTTNIATGGASTTNIGGAAANVNIGTTGGNSTLTIRGNATTGIGTVVTNAATASVFNTDSTTVNAFGAATAVNIGASTGTTTIANPTLTLSNGTSFNINGSNPAIASTNTGTASIFNANITAINLGQVADISMGGTNKTVTVRGALTVNGNTTLGDASTDSVTINSDVVNVNTGNNLNFVVNNAVNNSISYPVKLWHVTSGTPAVGIGTGLYFVTETAADNNEVGVVLDAVTTDITAGSEDFDFVVKTMVNGAAATQVLRTNNSTLTVGAGSTATTITTQTSSELTVRPGATGAAAAGNAITISGGLGGSTSGAGGSATFAGGNAQTSGAGGIATLRSGVAVGTNVVGANTIIEAGNGTGTGGSGSIIFRTAASGSSGSTPNTLTNVLSIGPNGLVTIPNSLTIGGNLTVNGTLTTVNSSTVTVDDKNLELASVEVVTGLTVTLTASSAIVTFINGSTTAGLLAGQTLTITSVQSGTPVFGVNAIIQSVDSLTQVTMSALSTGSGNAVISTSGSTDATANGGGITIKGTTDKTWNYVHANTAWTSNQNVDIDSGKVYKINAVDVLSSTNVLQNAATATIGSTAAAANVQIGANNQNNTLTILGNGTSGVATLTTNVTGGTVTIMNSVSGTVNLANAATTWNVGNTATQAQTVSMFGGSTGASTYSFAHGATLDATTKTINIGTNGVSGSTTNVNIGSAVSGALGTATINARTINLGTNSNAAVTAVVGPAITGNILKIAGTATGSTNVTSDVTTGSVNIFTGVTTGVINLATGGASTTNVGGAGAALNLGTNAGNSTLTINGNGTGGTAAVTTNVTTGTVNLFSGITTGTVNIATGGLSTTNIGGAAANVNIGTTGGNSILTVRGNGAGGTASIATNVTTGIVNLMTGITTGTVNIGSANAGRLAIGFNQASTSTTTGAVTIAGGLGVNGAVNALTKSFIIPHPTKAGKLLKHGSLEGPEFGVYVRGRCTGEYIELPDYWEGLVDIDTVTVDLTPIGKHQKLYVEKIEGLRVYIGNDAVFGKSVNCFYTVWAERKDVGKLDVEVDE